MAMVAGPGGVPPSLAMRLDAGWFFSRRLAVRFFADSAVVKSTLHAAEGSASVTTFVVGGDLEALLTSPVSRWRASAGAGLCALWLRVRGTATVPLVAGDARTVTAAPFARLSLALRLRQRVSLVVDGLMGYVLAEPTIVFAGRTVATFGRPFFDTALALRLEWR
jgi:hypothetical protein